MSRRHDSMGGEADYKFFRLVALGIESLEEMRQTPEAKKAIQTRNALANLILETVERSETIESLIHCEAVLQQLDERSAHSKQDKSSIENAQRDYRQLSATVAQMRRNPDEYFQANIALRDTGGDFRKLPRGRIQQIHANIARLRNRAAFAPEEEVHIWEARIQLAEKTAEMLRTMHKQLVKEYERRNFPE